MNAYIEPVVKLLIIFFQKEEHMAFALGIIVGIVIGGLVGVFVTPMFWKPK